MEEKIQNSINKRLDEIDEKLTRIVNTLVGDRDLLTTGYFHRIEELEKKTKALEIYKEKIHTTVIILAFIISIVTSLLSKFIN